MLHVDKLVLFVFYFHAALAKNNELIEGHLIGCKLLINTIGMSVFYKDAFVRF